MTTSPWGEHEIDYVLFITVPSKDSVTLKPHPDEVDDVMWVSQAKLLEMFDDKTLLFSPWFRIITNRWVIGSTDSKTGEKTVGWWDDLDRTMMTDDFCDYGTIHRFDPPEEHMGGGGDAGEWLVGGDEAVRGMENGVMPNGVMPNGNKANGEVVGDST